MTNRSTCSLILLISSLTLFETARVQANDSSTLQANRVGDGVQEITVPEGFTVELAAGPPLVNHPTFATFDDRGRLFVCENAGVNMSAQELEEKLPNSICMLEDTDGDGRFDKSSVFADKMTFPMGGAWHDGALYVASPPNIWRLEDTDGDNMADRREVLVGKFGYTGNAASIHGCILGPDGRLYWCDGYHGHEFKDATGKVTSQRKGSYIFSCLADGSDVRIHCGGGMDNPVEVDFTETGEMLGTVNIMYTRPRSDCLVHWIYGGAYPHREQVLSELKVTGDLLGPVHHFGHVAISGTMRYRSGMLHERWRDNMFATFFNSGKVVRLEISREGSTFQVQQREFLSCESRDFHPTDVAEDADGSLIVVDTGGWFYRGCPTSQFAKPDVLGAIYRVRRQGITPPEDPRGNRIEWKKLSNAALTELLGDDRFIVRERAIAESARRREMILPTLRQTIQHGKLRNRLNAVWALTRIVAGERLTPAQQESADWHTDARAAIRLALDDREPSVRQAACRSVATYPDRSAIARLLELLQDVEPPICREAATALGRIGDVKTVPALLAALEHTHDRSHEHAIIYALIEVNDAAATRAGLIAENAVTRRGALIALDQLDDGGLILDDVVSLVAADDAELQRTAAAVFSRHNDWKPHSAEVMTQLLKSPLSVDLNASVIRKLTAQSLGDESMCKLVGRILSDPTTPVATRNLLLGAMAEGQDVALHDSWIEPLERLLEESRDLRASELALAALSAIKSDRFQERLNRWGTDESRPTLLRVAALEAAAGQRGSLTDASLALLIGLLDRGPAESLQSAQRIGGVSLHPTQLIRLAPKLSSAGPSQLQELIRPFQRSRDAEVAKSFLAAMENASSLTSLAPHQFSDAIIHYPRELLPAANGILDRIRSEEQQKVARLDALLPLLDHGDVGRGRELFFSEKTKCVTCHRVGNQGGKVGPDLTTIGANRAARDLLESIVFPSATMVRDYEPYIVSTVDGQVFSGLIARETVDTLFVQQQTGEPIAIARGDIDELASGTVSIMPSGLEQALNEAELADLIAYLKNLTQPLVLGKGNSPLQTVQEKEYDQSSP